MTVPSGGPDPRPRLSPRSGVGTGSRPDQRPADIVGASVARRLTAVRERIRRAGGDPGRVRVVAVTKGFGPEAVEAALDAGLVDVGENYAQELVAKDAAVAPQAGERRWHFLGAVQRNKVAMLAPLVQLWHAVDRVAAGQAIAHRAPGAAVLVQVDVTGLPGRPGCRPADVPALVDALGEAGLAVRGVMAMGPPGPPEAARPGFRAAAAMADRLGLPERSMGMSGDLEVAVAEGATIVRLGRALFGDRPSRDSTWWSRSAHQSTN